LITYCRDHLGLSKVRIGHRETAQETFRFMSCIRCQ